MRGESDILLRPCILKEQPFVHVMCSVRELLILSSGKENKWEDVGSVWVLICMWRVIRMSMSGTESLWEAIWKERKLSGDCAWINFGIMKWELRRWWNLKRAWKSSPHIELTVIPLYLKATLHSYSNYCCYLSIVDTGLKASVPRYHGTMPSMTYADTEVQLWILLSWNVGVITGYAEIWYSTSQYGSGFF